MGLMIFSLEEGLIFREKFLRKEGADIFFKKSYLTVLSFGKTWIVFYLMQTMTETMISL